MLTIIFLTAISRPSEVVTKEKANLDGYKNMAKELSLGYVAAKNSTSTYFSLWPIFMCL